MNLSSFISLCLCAGLPLDFGNYKLGQLPIDEPLTSARARNLIHLLDSRNPRLLICAYTGKEADPMDKSSGSCQGERGASAGSREQSARVEPLAAEPWMSSFLSEVAEA